jgi:ribosomal protein L37AE/L43A
MSLNYPLNVNSSCFDFDNKQHFCNECDSVEVENEGDNCRSCKEELRDFAYKNNLLIQIKELKKVILEASDKLNRNMNFTAKEFLKDKIKELKIEKI